MGTEVIIFIIPIVAIIGAYIVKIIKIRSESNQGLSSEDKKRLDMLVAQNADMQERVENLETIITSLDKELLALQPTQLNNYQIQKKVEELANKLEAK
jgi:phage shock protein B